MKGVILAGGNGSRLYPCTKVTNKHLLPVFNKPMIHYPIDTLKKSGVQDILIISNPEHSGDFMRLLGSGAEFNVNFTYKIQDGAGGIAQALSLAEDFSNGETLAVILADNIFEEDFSEDVLYFNKGAQVFVTEVNDPSRFGVVELKKDGTVRAIEEKPDFPKSKYIQTGFYLYDNQVFDFIRKIKPSKRGELELTDVNNLYLQKKQLKARNFSGMWADAGTHESLLEANILAQEASENGGFMRKSRCKRQQQSLTEKSPKVTIGLLTHNSEKYIEPCLNSLLAQDYDNIEIQILDNASQDETVDIIQDKFEDISLIQSDTNKGFGGGHNEIIRQSKGEFYACLNVDMIFETNFISSLMKSITKKPINGVAGGKIKRWDFKAYNAEKANHKVKDMGKTNFLDSVGIKILKNHRFEDIGQGDVDYGQFDAPKEVFGISGAAVLYRKKALEDVAFKNEEGQNEYFDESMFMYKEDIDLAYRLQWAGWKCQYEPDAVAYHDRTIASHGTSLWEIMKHRSSKPTKINKMSFLNHQILLQKNYADNFSWSVRFSTWWYNTKVFLFILLFEQETLGQWFKLLSLRKKIKAQRKNIRRRISQKEIEKLMEI